MNVRRGLRTRCEMGLRPGVAPVGYNNEKHADKKCHAVVDPARAPIVKRMFEKVANEKWSGRRIHQWLKFELNFKSRGNKNMTLRSGRETRYHVPAGANRFEPERSYVRHLA